MKHITLLTAAFTCLALLTGCAKTLIPSEILQIEEHAPVYTAYNIWYENPEEIDCTNFQKGTILPYGTRIIFLKTTETEIRFRSVKSGQEFCILYDKNIRLEAASDFMKETFTTKNFDDLTEGMRPATIEKTRRGVVTKGMTKNEVLLAFGPPCANRTPSRDLDTWCYWIEFLVGKRVIFNNDRIIEILYL